MCQDYNLQLNSRNIMKMVVDFRRSQRTPPPPIFFQGITAERVTIWGTHQRGHEMDHTLDAGRKSPAWSTRYCATSTGSPQEYPGWDHHQVWDQLWADPESAQSYRGHCQVPTANHTRPIYSEEWQEGSKDDHVSSHTNHGLFILIPSNRRAPEHPVQSQQPQWQFLSINHQDN